MDTPDPAADVVDRWAADRRRVATVLHDDVVQSMSTALMALGLARMDQPDEPILRDAEQALASSAAALRQLIQELGDAPDHA
ncbi:MAG: histidine kinase [Acidimicrobiia bacterium]